MVSDFHQYMLELGFDLLDNCTRFSPHGQTFHLSNDEVEGFYWIYETDSFCVNIHDFHMKQDNVMMQDLSHLPQFFAFSFYLKSASGDFLTPYQTLSSNSSFIVVNQHQLLRILLHKHSDFFSVGIDFKHKMIEEYLMNQYQLELAEIHHIFQESHQFIKNKLQKLADEILNYHLTSRGSELFYEIKAKEWLSVIINEYYKHKNNKVVNQSDSQALENVVHYINDHLSTNIPQDLLAKIAMMSKTKLKNTFKYKYQMTMTEYMQRRRMNVAEQLLITTQLDIKEVAIAVGYNSHSRFSSLFKKYMGIYPHDVRKHTAISKSASCQTCTNPDCQLNKQ